MIDLEKDALRPVQDVIRARIGRRISPPTLWRWRLKGVNGVRLECVRVGGFWFTTEKAFAEFMAAQTANCEESNPFGVLERPKKRTPEMERRLLEAGVLG